MLLNFQIACDESISETKVRLRTYFTHHGTNCNHYAHVLIAWGRRVE